VIAQDFKDLAPDTNVRPLILGYAAGNDVSSRLATGKTPPAAAPQHGYAKSFDHFAPVGHCIMSPEAMPDVAAMASTATVNGEVRQQFKLNDLI